VLVDVTESHGVLGPIQRYEHAVLIAQTGGLASGRRFSPGPIRSFPDRFGETVARNRGLATRVVTDPDRALGWLLGDDP
jgi:hypothetical protein